MAISPTTPFELSKAVWTDEDFDQMGWHDVHVHALAFDTNNSKLLMDIDYMFAWVDPEPPSEYYTFWMSPCTLIFRNVHSFSADIEWGLGLEISDVSREDAMRPEQAECTNEEKQWKWVFECQEGSCSFFATGFTQFTRKRPIRASQQIFSWDERGGVCFDLSSYQ